MAEQDLNPVSRALKPAREGVQAKGGRKPVTGQAQLQVKLEWERVGDQAGKRNQGWLMEDAVCHAEEPEGGLTGRQVQVRMEGRDSAGREVLGSSSSSSPGERDRQSEPREMMWGLEEEERCWREYEG